MDYRAELIDFVNRNGKHGYRTMGNHHLRYKVRSDYLGIIRIVMDFSTASQGYIVFQGNYASSFEGKTVQDFALPADKLQEGFRLCNRMTRDHPFCCFTLDEKHVICGSLTYEFGSCFEPEACHKLARHLALHLERAYQQMIKTFPFLPQK